MTWAGRTVSGPNGLFVVMTSPQENGGNLTEVDERIRTQGAVGIVFDDYALDQQFYDSNLAWFESHAAHLLPVVYADNSLPAPTRTVMWKEVVLVISPLAMSDYLRSQNPFLSGQRLINHIGNANLSTWEAVVNLGIEREQALYPGSSVYLLFYMTQYSGWENPLPAHYLEAMNGAYPHEVGVILWGRN